MSGRIGISLGDPTGVGPEVVLKALAAQPAGETRFLLIGEWDLVQNLNQRLGLRLAIQRRADLNSEEPILLRNPLDQPLPLDLPPAAPASAAAAMAWLTEGGRLALSHEIDALVTAPLNKESIVRTGRPFVGQTEYLSERAGTNQTVMMLLGQDDRGRWLRVALATTHLPLRRVPDQLNAAAIELAIRRASEACFDLGLARARVGVCGLNPHAGEGGTMGTEEITTIAPAVAAARRAGHDAAGPLAADSLFYHAFRGEFDAVVAMYHDQGLGPLKMIGFERGVNWTVGLPFIRTSPDHGTAYDIAGQGKANPSSMLAAIDLAKLLIKKGRLS